MKFGKVGELTLHFGMLLVLLITLIRETFSVKGRLFLAEGFVFTGLLLIAVFGVYRFITKQNTQALLFVYTISLLNALVLFAWGRPLSLSLLVIGALGFFISFQRKRLSVENSTEEPWATSEIKIDEVPTEHSVYGADQNVLGAEPAAETEVRKPRKKAARKAGRKKKR